MYLTVPEVAQRLRLSPSCVYAMIERGELAHHRLGTGRGSIRVSEDDLAAYLTSRRRESARPATATPTPRRKLKHLRL